MLKASFCASALLLTLWACSSDQEATTPDASGGSGLGGGANEAGSPDRQGGSTNGGSAHPVGGAAAGDAPTDGGVPSRGVAGEGGGVETAGQGGGAGAETSGGAGDGGGPTVVTVPSTIDKSLTKQLAPLELGDPFVVEVGTRSFYPVMLTTPRVVPPEGWVLSHVEEGAATCPYDVKGKARCLQLWRAHLYPDAGQCQLVKAPLQWSWDVACAPGADCSTMPPDLEGPVTYNTTHNSESFCEGGSVDAAPFLPQSAASLPTLGAKPFTLQLFTTLNWPYTFATGDVTLPAGFSLVSFTEDATKSACDTPAFPGACRKWWNLVVNPGEACNASGVYGVSWEVGCGEGGGCNPEVTTYSNQLKLVDSRNLCAP